MNQPSEIKIDIKAELPPMLQVWIVGKPLSTERSEWEFQGVFASEGEAITACEGRDYFVAPAILGKMLPDETIRDWPGATYPNAGRNTIAEPMPEHLPTQAAEPSRPGYPLFLRRLDKFARHAQIAALAEVLRSELAAIYTHTPGDKRETAIAAFCVMGDAVAAFCESLIAGATAAAKREQNPMYEFLSQLFRRADNADRIALTRKFDGLLPERFTFAVADTLWERKAQEDKWGTQDHSPDLWIAILSEGVGELAQAVLHTNYGGKKSGLHNVRHEAIQVAAVAVAMVECLDRGAWDWPIRDAKETHAREHELWNALAAMVGAKNFGDVCNIASGLEAPKARSGHAPSFHRAVRVLVETFRPSTRKKSGKADS